MKKLYQDFVNEILGLKDDAAQDNSDNLLDNVIDMLLNLRLEAKANKDFAASDKIRDQLTKLGVSIKDKKDGFEWEVK